MAVPMRRFNPTDPRKWTEPTRRRRDGRAEIAAWMNEIEEDYTEAMEVLEEFRRELLEDTEMIWDALSRDIPDEPWLPYHMEGAS